MATLEDILQTIRPGAQWNLRGSSYDAIEWLDTVQAKPTQIEVNAALATYQKPKSEIEILKDRITILEGKIK